MASEWVADPTERLATEWDRDVSSTDTLMRAYVDAFAEMVTQQADAAGGRTQRDDTAALSDPNSPGAYLNAAVLLAPLADTQAGDAVARFAEFFAGGDEGQWLLFSATPTPDLRQYGLQLIGHPPLMLRPAGGDRRPPPDDLEIVTVHDTATLRTFEQTVIAAYPMPELEGRSGVFPDPLLDNESFRLYLGLVDGEPVGTSMTHLGASMSHVEWVTSIPAVRGRGYGEALTWSATLTLPDQPSMLIASDAGRPTYERMGYVSLTRFTLWLGSRD